MQHISRHSKLVPSSIGTAAGTAATPAPSSSGSRKTSGNSDSSSASASGSASGASSRGDGQGTASSAALHTNTSQKGSNGVGKWKNKLKSYLKSSPPSSTPSPGSTNPSSSRDSSSGPGLPDQAAASTEQTFDNDDICVQDVAAEVVGAHPYLALPQVEQHQQTQETVGFGLPSSDSYEARLSKLVGDLEHAEYGASGHQYTPYDLLSHGDFGTDGGRGGKASEHPYSWSASTPTNFTDFSSTEGIRGTGLVSIEDALTSFTTFSDYGFGDIAVPGGLSSSSSPSENGTGVYSWPISATTSSFSQHDLSTSTINPNALQRHAVESGSADKRLQDGSLSPEQGGLHSGSAVPSNSPADGLVLQEAGIAGLSMPFSFDDLKDLGMVDGGTFDLGGGKDDDEFAELLRQSQIGGPVVLGSLAQYITLPQEPAGSSNGQGLSESVDTFDLGLFPLPHATAPSPGTDSSATAGPSPSLSYGESSGSNTSAEEAHLVQHSALMQGMGKSASMQTLFPQDRSQQHQSAPLSELQPISASYSMNHLPAPASKLPPMPTSAPSTPHRPRAPPKIHASALTWRVAPTTLSPKSNIAVSPTRPRSAQTVKLPQALRSLDPFAAHPSTSPSASASPNASRLGRLSTVSVPELKRRRERDSEEASTPRPTSTSLDARIASHDGTVLTAQSPAARPIAGRRRVAGKVTAPPLLRHSQSQQQLYQPSREALQSQPHGQGSTPGVPMPSASGGAQSASWLTDDLVRNLYTQLDGQTFLCSIQGCQQRFRSEGDAHQHVQAHFGATSQQQQQQQQVAAPAQRFRSQTQPQSHAQPQQTLLPYSLPTQQQHQQPSQYLYHHQQLQQQQQVYQQSPGVWA